MRISGGCHRQLRARPHLTAHEGVIVGWRRWRRTIGTGRPGHYQRWSVRRLRRMRTRSGFTVYIIVVVAHRRRHHSVRQRRHHHPVRHRRHHHPVRHRRHHHLVRRFRPPRLLRVRWIVRTPSVSSSFS